MDMLGAYRMDMGEGCSHLQLRDRHGRDEVHDLGSGEQLDRAGDMALAQPGGGAVAAAFISSTAAAAAAAAAGAQAAGCAAVVAHNGRVAPSLRGGWEAGPRRYSWRAGSRDQPGRKSRRRGRRR